MKKINNIVIKYKSMSIAIMAIVIFLFIIIGRITAIADVQEFNEEKFDETISEDKITEVEIISTKTLDIPIKIIDDSKEDKNETGKIAKIYTHVGLKKVEVESEE